MKRKREYKNKEIQNKIHLVMGYRVTTVKRNGRISSSLSPVQLFNFSFNRSVFRIAFIPSEVN